MLWLGVVVSYVLVPSDFPVVIARPDPKSPIEVNTTLAEFSATLNESAVGVIAMYSDFPLRRAILTNETGDGVTGLLIDLTGASVFKNGSAIYTAIDKLGCENVTGISQMIGPTEKWRCYVLKNASFEDVKGVFENETLSDFVVVVFEERPKYSFSLANPFTPAIWNAIFFIILLVLLASWAIRHFSAIDVQTRFAKKGN